MTRVRMLAPGPDGHGVVRHADAVARLVAGHGITTVTDRSADLTHAQFTDALWGTDVAGAAATFTATARLVRRPLVATLHDVPGDDLDPARDARRTAGYARVAAVADLVVVSSRHEAEKVRAFAGTDADVVALPLPEPAAPGPEPAWATRRTLGVLGFVYPGKGHAEAVAAAARHPDRPRVVAAGAVSPGHDALWAELKRTAADRGVQLRLTGPLGEPDLAAVIAAVTVPLAPNRRVSASGSLLTWIAHGRVPLAAAGPYAREVAGTAPGALRLYDGDDELDAAVRSGLTDSRRGRRDGPLTWPDAGAAHAALYRRLLDAAR